MTSNFFAETLKARKAGNNTFQALKEDKCQSKLLYPESLSFKTKDK